MAINDTERLAIMQAFYKAAGEHVSTKAPGNLRASVDEHYKRLFEETGAKTFEMRVNGQKVGTYTVKVSQPKTAAARFEVVDPAELLPWVAEAPAEELAAFAAFLSDEFAEWHFCQTGEVPRGCRMGADQGQEGGKYMGGTLKVDPQLVAKALGAQLPEAMSLLLEGGVDD